MAKKAPTEAVNAPFPQDKIDLQFWQYAVGMIDIMNSETEIEKMCNPVTLKQIQKLIDKKKATIIGVYSSNSQIRRQPTFDLMVKLSSTNKYELVKTLIE